MAALGNASLRLSSDERSVARPRRGAALAGAGAPGGAGSLGGGLGLGHPSSVCGLRGLDCRAQEYALHGLLLVKHPVVFAVGGPGTGGCRPATRGPWLASALVLAFPPGLSPGPAQQDFRRRVAPGSVVVRLVAAWKSLAPGPVAQRPVFRSSPRPGAGHRLVPDLSRPRNRDDFERRSPAGSGAGRHLGGLALPLQSPAAAEPDDDLSSLDHRSPFAPDLFAGPCRLRPGRVVLGLPQELGPPSPVCPGLPRGDAGSGVGIF